MFYSIIRFLKDWSQMFYLSEFKIHWCNKIWSWTT